MRPRSSRIRRPGRASRFGGPALPSAPVRGRWSANKPTPPRGLRPVDATPDPLPDRAASCDRLGGRDLADDVAEADDGADCEADLEHVLDGLIRAHVRTERLADPLPDCNREARVANVAGRGRVVIDDHIESVLPISS